MQCSLGNGKKLLSALLVAAVCQDSKVLMIVLMINALSKWTAKKVVINMM